MDDDELERLVRSSMRTWADQPVPDSLPARASAITRSAQRASHRPWRLRWLGAAAAAAAGVVVLAVAASVLSPRVQPTASSVSSPGSSAAASPAVPSEASSAAAATPGWTAVGSGDTASGVWSPDGQRLLVLEGATNAPDADQRVLVVRADGSLERTLVGSAAVWVDQGSFIVWRSGHSYLEAADAGPETAIEPALPLHAVSNGRGAVAVSGGVASAQETFRVWTADRTTAPLPGLPLAWSPDGGVLAVWHFRSWPGGTGAPAVGSLEFLAWPSLTRISAPAQEVDWAPALFDPSGRYLYLAAPGPTVIDVQSGAALARPADFAAYVKKPSERVAWTADGRLVVPSLEGGSASVFDATGRLLQTVDGQFDSANGSADGVTVVLGQIFGSTSQEGAVLRAGSASPFALPAAAEAVSVAGSRVAVQARTDAGETVLVATVP